MIKKYKLPILLFVLLVVSCKPTKYVKDGDFLLNSYVINLDNTKQVNVDDLHLFVKQKPNTKIINYPFYLNVFYNSINPEKQKEREKKTKWKEDKVNAKRDLKGKPPKEKVTFSRWILDVGEAPVIYDANLTKGTEKEIIKYLKNRGFYYSKVKDTVVFNNKKANLTYTVETGKPYVIESVEYKFPSNEIANLLSSKIPSLPLKQDLFFDTDSMQSERMYITDFLKDNGYYFFQKEYIYFEADTSVGNYKVAMKVKMQKQLKKDERDSIVRVPHERFNIGQITMFTDFDAKVALFESDKYYNHLKEEEYENINFYHYGNKKLFHPSVLTRGLRIYEDSIFNLSKTKDSRQYLSSLGVFKTVNIAFEPTKDSLGTNLLDCKIQLAPSIPQSYKLELEGSVSGGWRTEASLNYKHLNLMKSASMLNITFSTALEKIKGISSNENKFFNNEKYGLEVGITIPKFLSPFKLTNFNRKYLPKTNLALKYDYQRRFDYTRTVVNASYGYFWKSSGFVSHSLRLADIYSTQIPKIESSYLADLYDDNNFERFFDHIIVGSSYSYLYTNKKQSRRFNFNFLKFDLEWAGNILFGINKLTNTEQTLGSEIFKNIIPQTAEIFQEEPQYAGLSTSEIEQILISELDQTSSTFTLLGLDYKQYVKTSFDFHQTFFLEGKMSWAYRLAGGIIVPFGNSNTAPIIKQFYVGGANSLRAWSPRQIGPGSRDAVFDSEGNLEFFESYGDIILEANAEFRFNIWWMFDGALFADAGNVWLIDNQGFTDDNTLSDSEKSQYFSINDFYNDIALNAGIGLRMDMDFLIVRFDIGFPLLDPRISGSNNWVYGQSTKLFKSPNLTFGIGLPF